MIERTHCAKGHDLAVHGARYPENRRRFSKRRQAEVVYTATVTQCRACHNEKQRRLYAAKKEGQGGEDTGRPG